jgi:putative transposase
VLPRLAYLTLCRSIQRLVLLARSDPTKDLEILVLRHQLTVLRRQTPRPKLEPADRALLAAVSRILPRTRWSWFLVKPETLLGWHRHLVAGNWTTPVAAQGDPHSTSTSNSSSSASPRRIPAGATSLDFRTTRLLRPRPCARR